MVISSAIAIHGRISRSLFGQTTSSSFRISRRCARVFGIKFFGATTIGGSGIQTEEILALLGPCISVHFVSMIGSYIIARKCRIDGLQSITIAIEVGLQNTALALLICSDLLSSNELSKPALVIALFSFFTTLVFAYLSKKFQNV